MFKSKGYDTDSDTATKSKGMMLSEALSPSVLQVIPSFVIELHIETHRGCFTPAVCSIFMHLVVFISIDGDLLGVRACTRSSVSVACWLCTSTLVLGSVSAH